jgi:hypothetical protein
MRATVVAASILALCACGSHTDMKRAGGGGVSLLVPRTWRVVSAGEHLKQPVFRQIERENPELGSQLRALERPSNPVKLLALAPRSAEGDAGSINVFVLARPDAETLPAFERRVLAQHGRVPGYRLLGRRRLHVANGPAAEVLFDLAYVYRGTRHELRTLQILMVRGGREYGVTYSAGPDAWSANRRTFRRSLDSIRIG